MARITGLIAATALLPLALEMAPGKTVPRLDLSAYPAPSAGEVRWVIQLPGVLRPSSDPALSANPADWRVELIVGRELQVDCNGPRLRGRLRSERLPGSGTPIYRVSGGEPGPTTRMACPPERGPRRAFVPLAGPPTVVPYNASLPIVVYAPRSLEVRWRLWKAESRQQPAQRL
jgi:ecotin